jgi:hypothetical protein
MKDDYTNDFKKAATEGRLFQRYVRHGAHYKEPDAEGRDLAPPGTVWVCTACGRHGKDRFGLTDSACWGKAVLCYEDKTPSGAWRAVPE